MASKRRRFAERRRTAGFSQEQLAEHLGVERSTVARWEAGETAPQPWLRPKVADALGVSPAELHELLTDVDDEHPTLDPQQEHEVSDDPMKRRTLLQWGVAVTASAGIGLDVSAGGGRVGSSEVARLEHAAIRLHNLDQQHGGDTLWQAAAGHLREAYGLLEHGSYSESIGQQLLQATGRLQICTGWLAFDAGHQAVARACYTEALALARQAADPTVETRAWANLAFQSHVLGRPREALRFAGAAEQAAAGLPEPSVLPAIPQLRQATASALVADARESDRAISQARKVLDRAGDEPAEAWCQFLSPAEIDAVEGACALELTRASRAEVLLEQAIPRMGDRYARNRSLNRVRLARARLDFNAVDGAVEAAHAALDDLTGDLGSWRVSNELDSVTRRFAAYTGVADVDSFLERYQGYQADTGTGGRRWSQPRLN